MKKALSLILSLLMVFAAFSCAVPFAFAENSNLPTLKFFGEAPTEAFYAYKNDITEVKFVSGGTTQEANVWNVSADAGQNAVAWLDGTVLYIGSGNGGVALNPDSSHLFKNFISLKSVDFGSADTSKVENFDKFFAGCISLESISFGDFTTERATNMREMFHNCGSLKNLDLSGFSIDNVTNLERMLMGCSSLEVLHIDNWRFPERLASMKGFLAGCTSLKEVYIYDVNAHNNCNPQTSDMYADVPVGLKFHDNRNITTEAELWNRFFGRAAGAVLIFDYPDAYKVTIKPDGLNLLKGESRQLEGKVYPTPENSKFEWVSSDTSVAIVDKDGLLKAVGVGKAIITLKNTTTEIGVNSADVNGVLKTKVNTSNVPCEEGKGNATYNAENDKFYYDDKGDYMGYVVTVTYPNSADYYEITYVIPEGVEYFQVSKKGSNDVFPVYNSKVKYLKNTELVISARGNALSYTFTVDGRDVDSGYGNRLDLKVNKDKVVSVKIVDVPDGEQTLNFFERIIKWFRDLFARLFGI